MPLLTIARNHQIDTIYRESYALWGAGLTFSGYRAFWSDLSRIPWARKHMSYHVWQGKEDTVLSSLKTYRPVLRLLGRSGRTTGIGAVFTPQMHRGQGYASAMLRAVLDQARERGDMAALLFTDIGTALYRAVGFRELPAEETWGEIGRRTDPGQGWTLRPMTRDDLDEVRTIHLENSENRPIAVLRDLEYWEYLLERSKCFFNLLDGSDLSARFQVALWEERLAGYLIAVDSRDVWIIREVAARGSDRNALGAILRAGAAQARSRGMRRIYGWLPREVGESVPDWKLRYRSRNRATPMLVRLDGNGDLSDLESLEGSFIPYLDQF